MIKSSLTPPEIDQQLINHYVALGRRERSRAISELLRRLFSAPERQTEQPALDARTT